MSDDKDWVGTLTAAARGHHPLVTSLVSTTLADLMRGRLLEGRLTRTEAEEIAADILAKMRANAGEAAETP